MKRYFWLSCLLFPLQLLAQDSTMNSLTKDMDNASNSNSKPVVKIFNSTKVINNNSTEVIGRGKMDFRVSHNFDDIAGQRGGLKNFFGLDNTFDVRIGFDIGLTDRLNINVAHAKGDERTFNGDSLRRDNPVRKLYEVALKYVLCRQLENDPSHPVAVTFFANTVVSTMAEAKIGVAPFTPIPNRPNSFANTSDRLSEVLQVIIAKKIGKISLQLSPTWVHYNYVPDYDVASTFALGGAIRIPFSKSFAFIVDYTHPFFSETKKTNYKNQQGVKFRDPLGVGVEITTAGHIFHLNFTNSTAILENQFIPYTTSSWGKGQYRWGFTISRTFTLWRVKGGK